MDTIFAQRIYDELKANGADVYDLYLPETHYLPNLIHLDEHIKGSVYGRYDTGRGALIATDQRVLFIDKKPMFLHYDELSFLIIGGLTFTKSGFIGKVTLHTRLGDFSLRTFNLKNAENFVDYIEAQCLQNQQGGMEYEHVT